MQDTSSVREKQVLYSNPENSPKPLTVVVQDPENTLRRFTRTEVFIKSKKVALFKDSQLTIWWALKYGEEPIEYLKNTEPHYSPPNGGSGLVVPDRVIKHWGLREGDKIGLISHRDYLLINSVNGISDPNLSRNRPDLHYVQSDYPKYSLPLEKFGDPDIRVVTLLSPLGLGSSHWIIAPGAAGKTWLNVKMIKATIRLLPEIPKLHIVIGFVGDRPEDGAQYQDAIKEADPERVEFYQSPWSDHPVNQIGMTKFITRRAQSLTASGKHTILFFDSITRAVSAHTAAYNTMDQGGMLKGGILRSSVIDVVQGLFGVHGCFPELDSSLTVISTALAGSDISSESVVEQETSGSSTTGITRLLNNPTLKFPKISVDRSLTYTRFPDNRDFRSQSQQQEMSAIWQIMWEQRARAEDAHQRLIEYVKINPYPKY